MTDLSKCGCVAGHLARKWGGRLGERYGAPLVGVAAAELVGPDPERVALTVVNLSANTVYLSPLTDVAATAGIRLNANGGSMTINADDDGTLLSGPWHAIASGANSQVFYISVRRVSSEGMEQHGVEGVRVAS